MRNSVSLALLLAVPATAEQNAPAGPTPYTRAIAAGYKAAMLCSGLFNAGRTERQVEGDELRGIYPDYAAIVPTLDAKVDRAAASVRVAFDAGGGLPPRIASWAPGRGCTLAPIGAATGQAPAGRAVIAPADPRPWPLGDGGIAPHPAAPLSGAVARAFDRKSYGEGSETIGVVILQDGKVVAERYRDGWGPFTSNRTWSVAKSIAGTLVGLSLADPARDPFKPANVPEWQGAGDPRAGITLDNLLRMGSGLHSDTAGNRTDAIYFGGVPVTDQAPGWPIEAKPGTRFRYANNDILLAIRAQRATLGEAQYRRLPSRLFAPLGMRHTVAEADWRGNYILSSQVWSTARDFARLGQFWLQDGMWDGKRLLPADWMRYMTAPSGPQPANGPGYGATMWLFGSGQGLPAGSYAAQGNRGQYIMVIPSRRLVVVRRGEDPGSARFDIARFTADVMKAVQ